MHVEQHPCHVVHVAPMFDIVRGFVRKRTELTQCSERLFQTPKEDIALQLRMTHTTQNTPLKSHPERIDHKSSGSMMA